MSARWKKDLESYQPGNGGGKFATFIATIATAILLAAWGQLYYSINKCDERIRFLEQSNAAICAHFNIIIKDTAAATPGRVSAKSAANPANSQLNP